MVMDDSRVAAVRSLVEPLAAEQDVEVVELSCRPQGRQVLVRLLVDKIGGITLAQCAQLNRRISEALEAADLIQESYTVEVSSPGLDRPLTTKRDYERTVGEEVWLDVRIGEGRFRETRGILLAIREDAVVLKTMAGNVTIPFADIRLAKKAVRW
jgi:ribosome maturation factor RimP